MAAADPDVFGLEGPVDAEGFYARRKLEDGRWLGVEPQTFKRARLAISVVRNANPTAAFELGYYDVWDYASRAEAIAAMEQWNGDGEPTGWIRHAQTGRRGREKETSR